MKRFFRRQRRRDFVSDFRVLFPHDKHTDASCEDCHQTHQPQGKSDDEFVTKPPKNIGDGFWLKKGTFKTRPLTHAGCFTCHNQESELAPLPQNCDACHKPPAAETRAADFDEKLARSMGLQDWWTLTAWRKRTSAGAFRHEVHPDLKCAQCHQTVTTECGPGEIVRRRGRLSRHCDFRRRRNSQLRNRSEKQERRVRLCQVPHRVWQ